MIFVMTLLVFKAFYNFNSHEMLKTIVTVNAFVIELKGVETNVLNVHYFCWKIPLYLFAYNPLKHSNMSINRGCRSTLDSIIKTDKM